MREKLRLDPWSFACDYLMRGGTITHERLRERSPRFVAALEAQAEARPRTGREPRG
jgi:hypothetical protein